MDKVKVRKVVAADETLKNEESRVKENNNEYENENGNVKKKRGRPKGTFKDPTKERPDPNTPKRKRGRPKGVIDSGPRVRKRDSEGNFFKRGRPLGSTTRNGSITSSSSSSSSGRPAPVQQLLVPITSHTSRQKATHFDSGGVTDSD